MTKMLVSALARAPRTYQGTVRRTLAAVPLLAVLGTGAPAWAQESGALEQSAAGQESGESAECVPLRIATIDILYRELFPERGGALGWAYNIGNTIHIDTKPSVVRNELLFEEGDEVDLEALMQTERTLRGRRFITESRVEILMPDGEVIHAEAFDRDLCVPPDEAEVGVIITTRDSWSLSVEGKLSKAGNKLLWEVGVDEANFLGLGKSVGFGYSRDIDRDSLRFGFHDPQLFGTAHELRGEYRDQSDGSSFRLQGGRFVRSLDDPWTYDGWVEHFDQNQPLYASGEQVGGLRTSRRHYRAQGGRRVHRGANSTVRVYAGFRQEYDDVEVEVRDYTVGQVGVGYVQHRYQQMRWVDHERPIDVNLGTTAGAWVGYAFRNESTRPGDTYFLAASVGQGIALGDTRFVIANAEWAARVRRSRAENGTLRARVTFADHSLRRAILLVEGRLVWGQRLDPEVQLSLGANAGLRGYRVNEFTGDRSFLMTGEFRYFFADDVLGLVSLGGSAFVDSGYVWARGVPANIGDLHTNAGFGLLIGRKQVSTSNAGMRIDLAYALRPIPGQNRWVLSFGATRSF